MCELLHGIKVEDSAAAGEGNGVVVHAGFHLDWTPVGEERAAPASSVEHVTRVARAQGSIVAKRVARTLHFRLLRLVGAAVGH